MAPMNTAASIRLQILSVAVQAIAVQLSSEQAKAVETALRSEASALAEDGLSADADAALAAELGPLLSALSLPRANDRGWT